MRMLDAKDAYARTQRHAVQRADDSSNAYKKASQGKALRGVEIDASHLFGCVPFISFTLSTLMCRRLRG